LRNNEKDEVEEGEGVTSAWGSDASEVRCFKGKLSLKPEETLHVIAAPKDLKQPDSGKHREEI
jgi:hypothetical protein